MVGEEAGDFKRVYTKIGAGFGIFSVNLYKEYTSLNSRELEELLHFRVMG